MRCTYEGCDHPATHLAPQFGPGAITTWKPICAHDHDAWWEGSDYPGGVGAPHQIRPVADGMELALCHWVNGRFFASVRGEPRHADRDSYIECIRNAYGSLQGVVVGAYERCIAQ